VYSLSNEEAVEEVVFGLRGILSGINEGQIAIDMSTVLPATSLREEEAYAKRGVERASLKNLLKVFDLQYQRCGLRKKILNRP
jgi:hypothetical protein